jgi:uncharacterized membrane protein YeaQ/YmgE (transglycosylase-associated protein family)
MIAIQIVLWIGLGLCLGLLAFALDRSRLSLRDVLIAGPFASLVGGLIGLSNGVTTRFDMTALVFAALGAVVVLFAYSWNREGGQPTHRHA